MEKEDEQVRFFRIIHLIRIRKSGYYNNFRILKSDAGAEGSATGAGGATVTGGGGTIGGGGSTDAGGG